MWYVATRGKDALDIVTPVRTRWNSLLAAILRYLDLHQDFVEYAAHPASFESGVIKANILTSEQVKKV